MERHTGGLRESCPRESLLWGISAGLWPIILICLILSLYLVYLRISPRVRAHLLAKMGSTEEAYGPLSVTPLLTSKEPCWACVVGEVS